MGAGVRILALAALVALNDVVILSRDMSRSEIVLESSKPETEWVRGRPLRKMSPTYRHGLAQGIVLGALRAWVDEGERGRVAPEWRFLVTPPGEVTRPLVPDIAFLAYSSLSADAPLEDVDVPRCSPTVAFEILSSGDRESDVRDKIVTYLASDTSAIVIVDAFAETVVVHDSAGERTLCATDTFTHAALPGFSLELHALFEATRSGA